MNALPDSLDELVIRLAPDVQFSRAPDGRPHADIQRGLSNTRFAIDPSIQSFLECFRTPRTLRQAAALLADDGFDPANVLAFGKSMLKTPLLEFHDPALPVPDAGVILAAAGLRLLAAPKDRTFDGVYHVANGDGVELIAKLLRGPVGLPACARVLARMRNEYAVLQRLRAVAAVPAVGRFVAAPHPFFTMAFLAGETLTDVAKRHCGAGQRLAIARDVITAMAQVHALGVIHGDLHTSNFLLQPDGQVRLIDFDCSFVQGESDAPRIGGAVHFIPPERMPGAWHGGDEVAPDIASEIYQLGVIVYLVLTGAPPFRGAHYAELADAVRSGACAPLCTTREGAPLDPALCRMVHACLSFRPQDRPISLEQVSPVFLTSSMESAS
jgi:serine/threonine protein kinase